MEKIAHLYSLEKLQDVFSIDKVEEVIPIIVSSDPNNYVLPGTPGIILKKDLLKSKTVENKLFDNGLFDYKYIPVWFPFPTQIGKTAGTYAEIYYKNIYPLPQKNLITNHKVKVIKIFEGIKFCDVKNFVTTNAAITFVMPDLLHAYNFWLNIPNLCSKYKYTLFLSHLGGSRNRRIDNDKFIPFISFIDIPYCIPIFDHHRVDGMGVYCGFMSKSHNKKTMFIDTLCFIVSNYRTNLFYLDGVTIGTPTKVNTNTLKYMLQTIKNEIRYKSSGECLKNDKQQIIKEKLDECLKTDLNHQDVEKKKDQSWFWKLNTSTYNTATDYTIIHS